jgi:hypothetical protein
VQENCITLNLAISPTEDRIINDANSLFKSYWAYLGLLILTLISGENFGGILKNQGPIRNYLVQIMNKGHLQGGYKTVISSGKQFSFSIRLRVTR